MDEAPEQPFETEIETEIPIVETLAAMAKLDLEDTIVAKALRRALADIDSPKDAVAGFQSAI